MSLKVVIVVEKDGMKIPIESLSKKERQEVVATSLERGLASINCKRRTKDKTA